MEGIKKLLDSVDVGDKSLLELTEPLVQHCEILANGNDKKFQKCLKESFFAGLFISENLELPPGIKPKNKNKV